MKSGHEIPRPVPWLSMTPGAAGVLVGAGMVALAFGVAVPTSPWNAAAILVLLPLGVAAPASTLVVILAITVLVPWDVQDHFKIMAGHNSRGVLFIDALMLIALFRTGWQILRGRIHFDRPMLLGTIVAGILAMATLWGLAGGADVSMAGNEGRRVLFGACAFLLAWPLLRDENFRRVLPGCLIAIGLALSIWGLAQWTFDVAYSTTGDVGVRHGLTSGQLQGGLYAYPVAVTLAWSALVAGRVESRALRVLLAIILALNLVCLFLTFERTLMVATVLACGLVVATAGPDAKRNAVRWAAVLAGPLLVVAVLAKDQASTAFERIALLGNVGEDNSFAHRMVEAAVLKDTIAARPIFGSGFGATVSWGVDGKFATSTTPFADLGFHWLAWKAGLPAALFITVILVRAVLRRAPAFDNPQWGALRTGSRGAVLALLVTSVMFGVFNALGITALMGLLVAICYSQASDGEGPRTSYREPAQRGQQQVKSDPTASTMEGVV